MARIDLHAHVHEAVRASHPEALATFAALTAGARGVCAVRLALALALLMLLAPSALGLARGGGKTHAVDETPERLADTGLYSDPARLTLASDVLAYEPQYPLWTDGATKRRWLRIPPGTAIDARDPDHFVFPVGTRLWKEFSLGRRIETRMLTLGTDESWHFASYVWSADGREAVLAPERGLANVAEVAPGVPYDVPGRADCCACHDGGAGRVLGFQALQLSSDRDPLAPHQQPLPAGALDLAAFVRRGLVRGLPQRFVATPPRIAAATPRERAVLGYLSANCGMCHASTGTLAGLGLDLSYSLADAGEPAARATTVERPSRFRWASDADPRRISCAQPELSVLTRRMASRQPLAQMPPIGTHLRDDAALELVRAWIREDLTGPGPAGRVATISPDSCSKTHP